MYSCRYSKIDFLRYSWGALMVNQFKEKNPTFGQPNADGSTDTLLGTYGLNDVEYGANMGYLLIFFCTFFVLTWATLSFKKYSAR